MARSPASRGQSYGRRASSSKLRPGKVAAQPREVIEVATSDEETREDGDEDEDMEEVELPSAPRSRTSDHSVGEDDEVDMEEVDIHHPPRAAHVIPDYRAVHQSEDDGLASAGDQSDAPTAPALVFHDGKGQPAPLSLTFNEDRLAKSTDAAKKKRTNILTPRDRAVRLDGHKLHVMALLAHAKLRNRWLNDDDLRDHLYNMSPPALRQKLRSIHPKKVPEQRERVRLFESFMGELVRWWAARFYLNPDQAAAGALRQPNADLVSGAFPPPGMRVDGWLMESEGQRERRHRREQKSRENTVRDAKRGLLRDDNRNGTSSSSPRGKGQARDADEQISPHLPTLPTPAETRRIMLSRQCKPIDEITIFPPGSDPSPRPALLRLLPAPEPIRSPADLLAAAEARSGSRETSAQLFCALCRALGIPARLVISPQVAPWSIGAGKVGQTVGAVESDIKGSAAAARGKGRAATKKGKKSTAAILKPDNGFARRGTDDDTSDDFDYEDGLQAAHHSTAAGQVEGSRRTSSSIQTHPKTNGGSSSRPVSVASTTTTSAGEDARIETVDASRALPKKRTKTSEKRRGAEKEAVIIDDDDDADDQAATNGRVRRGKPKGTTKSKKDEDYRDEKWKNLSAPLAIDFVPKLRVSKPAPAKETALECSTFDDVPPIDLASPPTMWVEVFSKPFQRWLTVDPIRARLSPTGNRHMEPLPQDRSNKLVYVVAFEEDGHARDVTARYTKTLHSRITKMRPPSTKSGGDWWEGVVRAMHRQQRLERDVVEDAELEEAACKEPMPNSIGGFKDHPVFALERHLRRDEVLHPQIQVGTFQGIPVFHRKNVVSLRSARQWYSEGRKVSEGQEALKWVKSRGYTLANKRAEEQARADGGEDLTEGLYARHQTELYVAPPVRNGIVPKNHFGNIDLFVPSMLPEGAAHIPHNGSAKIAKKLNVNYAEAIVGFEFRKHRSMPKLKGIVVPEEAEEMILDAYWENEQLAAEREMGRQTERALRHWRKLLNALRIAKRVQEQYGRGPQHGEVEEEDSQLVSNSGGGGGFLVEDDTSNAEVIPDRIRLRQDMEEEESQQLPTERSVPVERSKMASKLDKYGVGSRAHPATAMGSSQSRLRSLHPPPSDDDEVEEEQSAILTKDFADTEEEEKHPAMNEGGAQLVEAEGGRILTLDELARLEAISSHHTRKRDRDGLAGKEISTISPLTTTKKKHKMIVKFAKDPNGTVSAPNSAGKTRPRRAVTTEPKNPKRNSRMRDASTSEEDVEAVLEEEDDGSTPRGRSMGTRRSTRSSAVGRVKGSLKEPEIEIGSDEDEHGDEESE